MPIKIRIRQIRRVRRIRVLMIAVWLAFNVGVIYNSDRIVSELA